MVSTPVARTDESICSVYYARDKVKAASIPGDLPLDKIAILSLCLIFFSVVTIVLGIVKLHTYPGMVAERRGHPQKDAIEATSIMGLLIFPLWMLALIWAYSGAVIGNLYETPAEADTDAAATETESAETEPAETA